MDVVNIAHHRSRSRIRNLGEVFTPEKYVYQMLDILDKSVWSNENVTFFEPTCGHGNFVVAIVQKRLDSLYNKAKRKRIKSPHLYAIANTLDALWAIDIDTKNINLCRKRVWEVVTNFALFHNKVALSTNKNFWAHILCCIKWQIHENEMLSALEDDPSIARDKASQTIISKKWFANNGHHPIDFELSWVEYFKTLKQNGAQPMEFSRSLKFISALRTGHSQGKF